MKTVKKKLASKELSLGSWLQIGDTNIVEIMDSFNFDWLAVDLEHGPISVEQLPDIFRAMPNTFPFVRLPENNPTTIKRVLDAGAKGIIIPMINTREEAELAVSAAKYPPAGIRGIGFSRTNTFGKNFTSYFNNFNDNVIIIAQIEHIEGVKNAESILSVDGIDGYIIGPYDLSGSMNLTGQFDHPQFIDAINATLAAGKKCKKACGIHIVNPSAEELKNKHSEGYNFVAYGIDALFLLNSVKNSLNEIKDIYPQNQETK